MDFGSRVVGEGHLRSSLEDEGEDVFFQMTVIYIVDTDRNIDLQSTCGRRDLCVVQRFNFVLIFRFSPCSLSQREHSYPMTPISFCKNRQVLKNRMFVI